MNAFAPDAPRLCVDFGTALSKVVVARPSATGAVDAESVQPLTLGRVIGEPNPLLAPCAVFVDDERVLFGTRALGVAETRVEDRREPLTSFKSIMGASDIAGAIETLLPREIDPSGKFRRRDLIVLYLAWLTILVDNELGAEAARAMPLRYTRPDWSGESDAQTDELTARLFDEARTVVDRVGGALIADQGLNIDEALAATHAARAAKAGRSQVEGRIL
jgi:hypothetical protein